MAQTSSVPNPCLYGFELYVTDDEALYSRPVGGGWLFIEIYAKEEPAFWVHFYSSTGRVQTWTALDCRPMSELTPFLETAHQVLPQHHVIEAIDLTRAGISCRLPAARKPAQ